jgi:alcohol dehydrogenase class IV
VSAAVHSFQWPVRTFFGAGLAARLGTLVPPTIQRRRALVATMAEAWCQPLARQVSESLLRSGYQAAGVWAEIEPDPSLYTVRRGATLCRERAIDVLFALGGGSALDATKVIGLEAGIGEVVTVPTTAGTGSELNEWGVITDPETRNKESIRAVMPAFAILDPELTVSLPPSQTLLTGIDAFSHALECYVGTQAQAVTDALALTAMEAVAHWLPRAVEHGDDLPARTAMLEASMLAGGAMLGAGLGLMHGIGNVVGGLTHQPHGLILARLLDAVLAFNRPAIPAGKLARIQPLVAKVQHLFVVKSAEYALPEIEVKAEDLRLLSARAQDNVNSRTNPRPFTPRDIEDIVQRSFRVGPRHQRRG